jgi:hypothetical protein
MHNFSLYAYFYTLHVSGAMCSSSGELTVSMRTWYLLLCVADRLVCRMGWSDGQPHSVKYQVRIDTVNSPDDWHIGPETCRE